MRDINVDKLQFRRTMSADIPKCSEIFSDTWPTKSDVASRGDANKFKNAFINVARWNSTWSEVACISNNIVGFLFGRINSDFRLKNRFKMFFSILVIFISIISGKYGVLETNGKLSERFTFLKKFILSEIKIIKNHPKSDGEVILVVVGSNYKGKGIGKMLMDRFIDDAKSKNAKVITVYAVQSSNWKFYEIYGFRKYATFYDDMTSYAGNEDVRGFIYMIDLQ